MAWFYLAIAIVSEVIGTLALKASDGFNHAVSSGVCIAMYCVAFYFLALVVKSIPVGIAYAIWAGVGIFLITLVGAFWFKEVPDIPAIIGILLIITGVVVINLFSTSVNH